VDLNLKGRVAVAAGGANGAGREIALDASVADPADAGAYPITTYSGVLLYSQYADRAKGMRVLQQCAPLVGTGNCLRKYGARDRKRVILKGDVPSQINPPPGCHFHPRCPYALARCRHEAPALREIKPGHWASCHLHEDGVRVPLAKLGRE
jgi:oligopeptide/dipeptide ABC transporter ATP-binding protein